MDLRAVGRLGGGVREWLWKGGVGQPASVSIVVGDPRVERELRHTISFYADPEGFRIDDETVDDVGFSVEPFHYVLSRGLDPARHRGLLGRRLNLSRELPILAQRRDPEQYPEFTHLAES